MKTNEERLGMAVPTPDSHIKVEDIPQTIFYMDQ